jgi:hypothetical protein
MVYLPSKFTTMNEIKRRRDKPPLYKYRYRLYSLGAKQNNLSLLAFKLTVIERF